MGRGGVDGVDHKTDTRHGRYDVFEQLHPFAQQREIRIAEASDIPAGACETVDNALTDWIGGSHEHDRDAAGLLLQGEYRIARAGKYHIRAQSNQFFGIRHSALVVAAPSDIDLDVATVTPS